jgi:hypothetical protein
MRHTVSPVNERIAGAGFFGARELGHLVRDVAGMGSSDSDIPLDRFSDIRTRSSR